MIYLLAISLIIGLVFTLLWAFVINDKAEKELRIARDRISSLMIGKKLIVKKTYLRSEEFEYLRKLEDLLQDKYIVKPQIHLSDIADVEYGYYDHDNLFYELKSKIIDYVIFDKQYQPLVGIELNGKSHFFKSRKSRDKLTENLLNNIGIEYLEIDLLNPPDRKTIMAELENKINLVKQKQVFPRPL